MSADEKKSLLKLHIRLILGLSPLCSIITPAAVVHYVPVFQFSFQKHFGANILKSKQIIKNYCHPNYKSNFENRKIIWNLTIKFKSNFETRSSSIAVVFGLKFNELTLCGMSGSKMNILTSFPLVLVSTTFSREVYMVM